MFLGTELTIRVEFLNWWMLCCQARKERTTTFTGITFSSHHSSQFIHDSLIWNISLLQTWYNFLASLSLFLSLTRYLLQMDNLYFSYLELEYDWLASQLQNTPSHASQLQNIPASSVFKQVQNTPVLLHDAHNNQGNSFSILSLNPRITNFYLLFTKTHISDLGDPVARFTKLKNLLIPES